MTGSIDKDESQGGGNAAHKGQKIPEVIRVTQIMESEVREGGPVQGQSLPGDGPRNLVKRGPDKVETGFSWFLWRVFVGHSHLKTWGKSYVTTS